MKIDTEKVNSIIEQICELDTYLELRNTELVPIGNLRTFFNSDGLVCKRSADIGIDTEFYKHIDDYAKQKRSNLYKELKQIINESEKD